jgi:hypothetical protein
MFVLNVKIMKEFNMLDIVGYEGAQVFDAPLLYVFYIPLYIKGNFKNFKKRILYFLEDNFQYKQSNFVIFKSILKHNGHFFKSKLEHKTLNNRFFTLYEINSYFCIPQVFFILELNIVVFNKEESMFIYDKDIKTICKKLNIKVQEL